MNAILTETMTHSMVKVLVIGETRHGSSYLLGQLESRGCRCWFAHPNAGTLDLFALHSFHLILSTVPMHPQDPLLDRVTDSNCTVYCSFPVEDSCWWIPLVYRGRNPQGKPALRPSEFLGELGKMVKKIQTDLEVPVSSPRPQAAQRLPS
jgi:hypothetical protein